VQYTALTRKTDARPTKPAALCMRSKQSICMTCWAQANRTASFRPFCSRAYAWDARSEGFGQT